MIVARHSGTLPPTEPPTVRRPVLVFGALCLTASVASAQKIPKRPQLPRAINIKPDVAMSSLWTIKAFG